MRPLKQINPYMTDQDWISAAETFNIGNSNIYPTNIGGRFIQIVLRSAPEKYGRYAVLMDNTWVLGKDGKYHYEPMPSSRSVEFIKNTRFESKEQALDALNEHERMNKPTELTVPTNRL